MLKAVWVSLKAVAVPRKDALAAILSALFWIMGWGAPVWGQEAGGIGGDQTGDAAGDA